MIRSSNESFQSANSEHDTNKHLDKSCGSPGVDNQQQQAPILKTTSSSRQLQDQDDSSKPKRNPFCSRCRNHGKSAQVKGHKRHCEYRYCQCEGCRLVEMRQIVSARQIKRRRNLKQDEECGRSIEVSPPVLKREPDNDLATLIASTLIGSTPSTKHLPLHVAYNKHDNHHSHLPATSVHHQLHPNHHSNVTPSSQQNVTSHPISPKQPEQKLNSGSPVSSALSNAIHLFHFPNPVLSAAAAASFNTGPSPGVIIPSAPSTSVAPTSSPPIPSFREQIALVDEIYNSFGPLAIYAWLKVEQFNLRRVHELIETSQTSYNNLLDSKSKFNLNNNNSNDRQQQHITLALNGSGAINSCVNKNNNHNLNSDKKRQETNRNNSQSPITPTTCSSNSNSSSSPATSSGSLIATTTCTNTATTRTIDNPSSSSSSTNIAINCSNLSSATISSTPSPLYTVGKSYSSANCNSSSSSIIGSGGDNNNDNNISGNSNNSSLYINDRNTAVTTAAAAAAAAHHQHNMSLASTLNPLPISTAARDFLWPSLKMSGGNGTAAAAAAAAAAVMHPHHFLPHFMHHHPFGAHHQHYLQQVSPAQLSNVTNLSSAPTAASSSSTVL